MQIGVNYTPRSGWFHSWLDLDLDAVRADFAAIADAGLDHVRIFPLWPLLQPNRTMIRSEGIADVIGVVDAAAEHGLDVFVDALNGHLSSFDFLPSWVVTWHDRDLFTDADVISGQRELIKRLGSAVADRPNAGGISLGNEIAQFASPWHPHPSTPSTAAVDDWLGGHFSVLQEIWPDGEHTHSFDDSLWFSEEHPFVPRHAVEHGDSTTVHAWVFGGVGQRYGERHPALAAFPRYLCEVAAGWGGDDRPVWLQEVGAPVSHVAVADAPAFATEALRACAGMPGLERITWWCSHDVARAQADFPELEYNLGLFDEHGARKPIGDAVAAMIPELKNAAPTPALGEPLTFAADRADGRGRSAASVKGELFDAWQASYVEGTLRPVRPESGDRPA